jgi:hypothetical protein
MQMGILGASNLDATHHGLALPQHKMSGTYVFAAAMLQ